MDFEIYINPLAMNKPTYTLFAAFALLLLLQACSAKMNVAREEEAIKTVINKETQAWIDKDPDKMKEFYLHDSFQTRVNIQDSVYTVTSGWDKRATAIDTLAKYADWVGVDQFKVEKDFIIIKVVDAKNAWAILREKQNMVYNGSPATAESIITVLLEKPEKDWKISCFVKGSI
jgi:hypothetical protein